MRIIIVLAVLFFLTEVYSQDGHFENPFESLLPVKRSAEGEEELDEGEKIPSLAVKINGILWGVDVPRAIIDNDIYKAGDKLKDEEAQVLRIEKSTVFILYGEKVYELKVE